jgi:HEPN domain-containing protein
MNRIDFQEISGTRLREAQALLDAGFPDGAYYLAGYAVECALKACIAKRTREHDFPEKKLANDSYTHDLGKLIQLALLEDELDMAIENEPKMDRNWTLVQRWSETSRYEQKTLADCRALIGAIEDQPGGLLPWLRKRW